MRPMTCQVPPPASAYAGAGLPRAGLVQLALSVVLVSSAYPLTKLALGAGATPLWFAVGRAGLSGLTAFSVLAASGRLRLPGRRDGPALLAVGVLQFAGFLALVHAALAWVPAGRTAVLSNTTTIWMAPLALLLLHEAIPARRRVAAGLGVAGVAVLVGPWALDWGEKRVLIGHAFLLAASLAWAVAIAVVRTARPRLSMLALLPWCFALATALLAPLAWWWEGGPPAMEPGGWAALLYIGLVAGPVGTWCVMEASVTLPAMVASTGFLATPAVGLLLSAAILGEALTPDLLAGSALVLAGAAAAAWPARGRA